MATALITGGSGFIGSHLSRALVNSGWIVHTYDVKPADDEANHVLAQLREEIQYWEGSVEYPERLQRVLARVRPDAVLHAAAVVDPVWLSTEPVRALQVNVNGAVNALEAARIHGVTRFVLFSSIGVLPEILYEPVDVQHPLLLPRRGPGAGFYGASKVAAEAFALSYSEAFGFDVRILRPSAVYGLGMRWPIYLKPMVEGAVRGEHVHFATGGSLPRDYTHVSDVTALAAAVLHAAPDDDHIYFAATGEPLVTAAELATMVMDLVPGASITIGADLGPEDLVEARYRGRLSIENARRQLGWEPHYRDLRAGLVEYIDSYRSYRSALDSRTF
jgi:nucleoside-diphosphate-sugar epimerase